LISKKNGVKGVTAASVTIDGDLGPMEVLWLAARRAGLRFRRRRPY